MASSRLRKAFRYPRDEDDGDDYDEQIPTNMDEEEQEKLISRLRKENDERNKQYERIFIAVALAAIAAFLPCLQTSQLLQAKLVALLSIFSVLCTAYILAFLPNINSKQNVAIQNKAPSKEKQRLVQTYLVPPLNGFLTFVIGLHTFTFYDNPGVHRGFWLTCMLPAAMLCMILAVRHVMRSVDVTELESLKYEYKGA